MLDAAQEAAPADMQESVARQQQLLAEAAAVHLLERQQREQVRSELNTENLPDESPWDPTGASALALLRAIDWAYLCQVPVGWCFLMWTVALHPFANEVILHCRTRNILPFENP